MEIIWAVLTFAQSRVTKLWHVYLLRALIGFFEAPSFGGTHLIRALSEAYAPSALTGSGKLVSQRGAVQTGWCMVYG
jgi:hypothetical protein